MSSDEAVIVQRVRAAALIRRSLPETRRAIDNVCDEICAALAGVPVDSTEEAQK